MPRLSKQGTAVVPTKIDIGNPSNIECDNQGNEITQTNIEEKASDIDKRRQERNEIERGRIKKR